MKFLTIPELLLLIDAPNQEGCQKIYEDNKVLFQTVQGSTNNHQAWKGGYHDHIQEVMNLGKGLFEFFQSIGRELPFSLSDVLLVLYLHDIEKPWKYNIDADGVLHVKSELEDKEAQHTFRASKLKEYGIELSDYQQNAMRYVEGELHDYSSRRRVMNELAAMCHLADVSSARIYYDYPLEESDSIEESMRVRNFKRGFDNGGKSCV